MPLKKVVHPSSGVTEGVAVPRKSKGEITDIVF